MQYYVVFHLSFTREYEQNANDLNVKLRLTLNSHYIKPLQILKDKKLIIITSTKIFSQNG